MALSWRGTPKPEKAKHLWLPRLQKTRGRIREEEVWEEEVEREVLGFRVFGVSMRPKFSLSEALLGDFSNFMARSPFGEMRALYSC